MGWRSAAIGATVVAVVGVLCASAAVGGSGPAGVAAGVELKPDRGASVRGAAFFTQRGRRLSGWVVVWGLEPRSAHAVHFHGPRGSCASQPAKPAVAGHADLRADARGVAFTRFVTVAQTTVLRRGFYYNVHAGPSTAGSTPSITCGNIRPLPLRS